MQKDIYCHQIQLSFWMYASFFVLSVLHFTHPAFYTHRKCKTLVNDEKWWYLLCHRSRNKNGYKVFLSSSSVGLISSKDVFRLCSAFSEGRKKKKNHIKSSLRIYSAKLRLGDFTSRLVEGLAEKICCTEEAYEEWHFKPDDKLEVNLVRIHRDVNKRRVKSMWMMM